MEMQHEHEHERIAHPCTNGQYTYTLIFYIQYVQCQQGQRQK
jgi:hypothetical protein